MASSIYTTGPPYRHYTDTEIDAAKDTDLPELLASLAEYAGCHLYNTQDDVVYANANFVAIHASFKGRHTIRFKAPCSPFEVYEKRYYGHNVTEIEVDMRLGDTLMFSLQGAC